MMNKIRKYIALIFAALLFVSCSNLVEAVNEPDEVVQKKSVSSVNGECYVSFSLEEPTTAPSTEPSTEPSTARTVLPYYNYDNCLFKLYGTRGDDSEVLLLNKVSYNDLIKARNVSVKSGTWTFTVECFDSNDKKILSGTSIPVNITSGASTIQIPMTFITGTAGSIEVSLNFPSGTDIATVASVKAGLYNSPIAAAGDSCVSLDITNNGETSSVTYSASNLESGLTKYVKFFIYSEAGVELGHYTEAVIIGDNLTSRKELSLSTLRSANVLTLTLKTNGSTYVGETKNLYLKSFPNEEKSYPMTLNEGTADTYSAKIVNGTKYILYDGYYNTKLIFIPTASETSDGIVEYCDSFADAANVLKETGTTSSGLGLIIKDNEITSLGDYNNNAGTDFYRASVEHKRGKISINFEECTAITGMVWYSIERIPMLISVSYPKNNKSAPNISNSYLAALYINEGVENYDYSLYPTASLEYLYLPSTLTSINCSGLGNCIKLKNVVISDANEKYTSDGERIMTKDGKTLLSWPSVIGAVEIPEGITSIDSGAFCNNTRITDISLPSTLEKIGDQVFSGCSTLRNVNIPEGVTSIGNESFANCSNLKSMDIPKGVTSIGYGAFYGCSNLKSVTIPEGVTSIGNSAFYGCHFLESVVIPSTIKKLGDTDDEYIDNWNGIFGECESLRNVVLPDGLEEIGEYVFYDCYNLKTIDIPDTVTKICAGAFCYSGLTSLIIPDSVTYIGYDAFGGTRIASLVIPESVTFIGVGAFASMKSDSIKLPSTLERIESYLFRYSEIKSLVIPDSVTSIGSYAFADSKIETIVIPGNVETIEEYAFSGASIKTVTFPASVTSIGQYAFSNLNLTSLVIPDTVIAIGDFAFYNCKTLETVTIGNGVNSIGKNPFRQCKSISSVNISSDNPYYMSENSSIFSKDKKKLVYWHLNGATEIIIPDSVEEICDYCFADMNAVTKVDFPSKLSIISNSAFYNMELLSELKLPSTMTSIGDYAFYNCNKIKSLEFPDNITNIGKYAFYKCSSVESVKLPAKLSRIKEDCFGYNSFKTIIIPNSVGYVEEEAFYQSKVETVCFKEGRYSIESHWRAFKAPNLTKVYLPKSLGYIRYDSFEYAEYLTDVYYAGSESDWSKISIGSSNGYLLNATRHYGETYQETQD